MKQLKDFEKFLDNLFKGLPPLPENIKKWIADNAWIFAIIGVVFGVIGGVLLLTSVIFVSAVVSPSYVNNLYAAQATTVSHLVLFAWVALVALAVNVYILLKAYPKLKAKSRAGWDLLFLSAVLWFVYDIFNWVQYVHDFGSFLGSIVSTAIGFYILFQIRDKFSSKSSSPIAK